MNFLEKGKTFGSTLIGVLSFLSILFGGDLYNKYIRGPVIQYETIHTVIPKTSKKKNDKDTVYRKIRVKNTGSKEAVNLKLVFTSDGEIRSPKIYTAENYESDIKHKNELHITFDRFSEGADLKVFMFSDTDSKGFNIEAIFNGGSGLVEGINKSEKTYLRDLLIILISVLVTLLVVYFMFVEPITLEKRNLMGKLSDVRDENLKLKQEIEEINEADENSQDELGENPRTAAEILDLVKSIVGPKE